MSLGLPTRSTNSNGIESLAGAATVRCSRYASESRKNSDRVSFCSALYHEKNQSIRQSTRKTPGRHEMTPISCVPAGRLQMQGAIRTGTGMTCCSCDTVGIVEVPEYTCASAFCICSKTGEPGRSMYQNWIPPLSSVHTIFSE